MALLEWKAHAIPKLQRLHRCRILANTPHVDDNVLHVSVGVELENIFPNIMSDAFRGDNALVVEERFHLSSYLSN